MTGRRVWWYFLAFFGFIAAVNAVMVTLAISTHSGIVTEHPYEKGLDYNQVVEAEQQQEALGWKGIINYKNGMLNFTLRDKKNHIITPERATATITRPTQQGMDFTVELNGTATAVRLPVNGLWKVQVDAMHEGVHYQQSKRIVME